MRHPHIVVVLVATGFVASACGDKRQIVETPPPFLLELVGPDTFLIQDTPINPGCHYHWVMQATGPSGAAAQLLAGRILSTSNIGPSSVPTDTVYTWTAQTVKGLFNGNEWFGAGETRTSGPYATVGSNVQSHKRLTIFDYLVVGDDVPKTVSQISYCIRP